MLVPYIERWDGYSYHCTELKPTGKWKIVNNVVENDVIYVQHKGWFLKTWVHENRIEFHRPTTTEVFDCKGGEKL